MSEHQLEPGFVKNKIKAQKPKKKRPRVARAHSKAVANLTKIVKKAASIAELLTADDQLFNVRLLRRLKRATNKMWDPESKTLIDVDDNRTQLAALLVELQYTEGKPIERALVATGSFEDLGEMLRKMQSSPAASRSLPAIEAAIVQGSLQSGQSVSSGEQPLEKSD